MPVWAPCPELPAPEGYILPGEEPRWLRTDWWSTAFWLLNGVAERALERHQGPIHSYSLRLSNWDSRLWERPWVNLIAIFLRRWAERHFQLSDNELGALPRARILSTHDVDAVVKTPEIRLKQTAFHAFNSLRNLVGGRWTEALSKAAKAARFLLSSGNYWRFEELLELQEQHGIEICFFFYGGQGGWRRSPPELLFDPAYRVTNSPLDSMVRRLRASGCHIGLHQSFRSWSCARRMIRERRHLEQALQEPVSACRQHWLRFSWENTWKAQQAADLRWDATLGFNDRPGFRNSAALRFPPWGLRKRGTHDSAKLTHGLDGLSPSRLPSG